MNVYVDNALLQFGRMRMCHLIADSSEELLAFVDSIGVDRKWLQYPGTGKEHFDICMSKRNIAIKKGAIPITWGELSRMTADRQARSRHGDKSMTLCTPDALEKEQRPDPSACRAMTTAGRRRGKARCVTFCQE